MKTVTHSKITPERIMQLSWGYAPPLIVEAAVKHHLFDLLDAAPLNAQQLARQAGVSVRGVTAICNALVGLKLLARDGGRYTLTPESATFLVSHKPAYHGAFFHHISTQLIPKWLALEKTVRTGRSAATVNSEESGASFFAEFVESIFPLSYAAAKALGKHLGISKAKTPVKVLDLAAGSGVWGIALAEQSPRVHVTAVDWPPVLAVTQRIARRHGVGNRLTVIPGDILKVRLGKNHQVATLGHILHSEGRARSRKLIKKTFHALAPGGTIAIMEFLVNHDRTEPVVGLLFAVNMLVNTEKGDTFSFVEISGWLREAGFTNPRLLKVPAVSPLVLATKP
ncbi:MAG TPA: methyltransferase dimerization domain-containing protein [Candidatus Baltobacteraceae bacterium]|jgi:SAM-dependent methyltransferase|nr:methyltransferase dimerization domain-containing protein [Candidatus Baltobacteraceae bacterium]